jgi:ribulose-phosphate 3-epimerase
MGPNERGICTILSDVVADYPKEQGQVSVSICPTVTTDDPEVYRMQIEQTVSYAHRVHIDLSDGVFTKNKLMDIENVWWPGGMQADLHVMYQRPFDHIGALAALRPQLIIVHAEAEGDFMQFAELCHSHGIEVGVALLPETPVEAIEPALGVIEHVLIFSGHLGHFGGHADMHLLGKAQKLRQLKPSVEIGWDGGVSDKNARALALGDIDVLNAGGFLHGAKNPAVAYAKLLAEVKR